MRSRAASSRNSNFSIYARASLACDGVVFDVRHFPRTDDDYLAQVKKMAVDRGLSIAALADPTFFTAACRARGRGPRRRGGARRATRRCAAGARDEMLRGASSLRAWMPQRRLQRRSNVTLALRNAPQTFAALDARLQTRHQRDGFGVAALWIRNRKRSTSRAIRERLAANTILLWSDVGARKRSLDGGDARRVCGFSRASRAG